MVATLEQREQEGLNLDTLVELLKFLEAELTRLGRERDLAKEDIIKGLNAIERKMWEDTEGWRACLEAYQNRDSIDEGTLEALLDKRTWNSITDEVRVVNQNKLALAIESGKIEAEVVAKSTVPGKSGERFVLRPPKKERQMGK